MKVTVIGSHLCPDTLYALNKLVEAKADITFQNLSASLPDLKAYLALRESSPVFEGGAPKIQRLRFSSGVAWAWNSVPTEMPSITSPITPGLLPAAIMVSIPARQATSAACNLVLMPPVPRPETLSPAIARSASSMP